MSFVFLFFLLCRRFFCSLSPPRVLHTQLREKESQSGKKRDGLNSVLQAAEALAERRFLCSNTGFDNKKLKFIICPLPRGT